MAWPRIAALDSANLDRSCPLPDLAFFLPPCQFGGSVLLLAGSILSAEMGTAHRLSKTY
jgi:hypothetical protein